MTIVSDNGTELISNAILRWADDHKIEWHYIAPDKPLRRPSCLELFLDSISVYGLIAAIIGPLVAFLAIIFNHRYIH
jgi:hypothetical protein